MLSRCGSSPDGGGAWRGDIWAGKVLGWVQVWGLSPVCERIIWSSDWKNICSHTSHSNVLMSMTHTHTHTHTALPSSVRRTSVLKATACTPWCLSWAERELHSRSTTPCSTMDSSSNSASIWGGQGSALWVQLCRCEASNTSNPYTLCIKQYIRTYILYVHTCTNGCTYTFTHTHTCTHIHTHCLTCSHVPALARTWEQIQIDIYISYIITYIDKPKTFIMRQHWPLAA